MPTFYEFFAGGGMARAGLGPNWQCLFANEIDQKKAAAYRINWKDDALLLRDVAVVKTADLPGAADLAWASFPCQDLSLAGAGAGLRGDRSGTFWPFWRLIESLDKDRRAPTLVVLENVCGALTSHQGKDFAQIGAALASRGYRFGAVVVDAAAFLPQSRPRLFIIGIHGAAELPAGLRQAAPSPQWHPRALVDAHAKLDAATAKKWVWWTMPPPARSNVVFVDLIEDEPKGVKWHTAAETQKLLSMMSEINRNKVRHAIATGRKMVGGIYKRTRFDHKKCKVQRAEIRFDDMAGCLRTPVGGSSRQSIMVIEGATLRSRLISPRETAQLMGLPDDYILPGNYNEAYHLTGDGVAVPVVRHLAAHILEPLLKIGSIIRRAA